MLPISINTSCKTRKNMYKNIYYNYNKKRHILKKYLKTKKNLSKNYK